MMLLLMMLLLSEMVLILLLLLLLIMMTLMIGRRLRRAPMILANGLRNSLSRLRVESEHGDAAREHRSLRH